MIWNLHPKYMHDYDTLLQVHIIHIQCIWHHGGINVLNTMCMCNSFPSRVKALAILTLLSYTAGHGIGSLCIETW